MVKNDRAFSAKNFRSALQEITSKLPQGTYALVGGLAVGHWVQDRKTQDLDFALLAQEVRHLKKMFPQCLGEGAGIYSAKVGGVTVDFLKPAAYSWNCEAIQNAKDQLIEGVILPVVPPEYLILYKMHAERELDLEDVVKLLKLPGIYVKARRRVKRYLSSQHLEELDQLANFP